MINIINVCATDAPMWGTNQYVIKINQKVITCFEHERTPSGLASCLRAAADAVEKKDNADFEAFVGKMQGVTRHSA